MRIAYVCADPGVPVFGRKGSSVHVQEIIRALAGHGAHLSLFARRFDGAPPSSANGLSIHQLPTPSRGDLGARERSLLADNAALRSALEREGPFDFIYERHALWSFAAMEYAAERGIPGLLEVNSPLIEEQAAYRELSDSQAARRAAERAFRAASVLLPVSEAVAEYLKAQAPSASRVNVLPNGVDPERIRPDMRPSLPGAPGVLTVGFVGTLKAWHGLETLIEAFAELRGRHDGVRLLIVGDGPEREHMQNQMRSLDLLETIQFTGAVDPAEVPALLTSMDIGVAPYPHLERFYFSPLKLYEYMAAGLPIVASRIGQVADVIEHGASGLLCPPGDAQAFTEALTRFAEDRQLRHRLGSAAREAALRRHTWRSVAARILELASMTSAATREAR